MVENDVYIYVFRTDILILLICCLNNYVLYAIYIYTHTYIYIYTNVCTFYYSGVQAYGDMHRCMVIFIVYMCYSTMVLLIGNISLHHFSQKSLIHIDFCDVNRVVQLPHFYNLNIFFFTLNNISIIFLSPTSYRKRCNLKQIWLILSVF